MRNHEVYDIPRKSKPTKLCPLVRSEILAPWIILTTHDHSLFGLGLPGYILPKWYGIYEPDSQKQDPIARWSFFLVFLYCCNDINQVRRHPEDSVHMTTTLWHQKSHCYATPNWKQEHMSLVSNFLLLSSFQWRFPLPVRSLRRRERSQVVWERLGDWTADVASQRFNKND